jgi:hypothetical protein
MSNENVGNRNFKDTVFRLLFNDAEKSAELYNAINGTKYKPKDIAINTIQNPFFVNVLRNDLSFTIGDKLIALFEHNSTKAPNIGLRFLFYVSQLYEMSIDDKKILFKENKMTIPVPEFIMLYNGKDKYPDNAVIKLSDLFQTKNTVNLELIVKVYNVNKGRNSQIMKRSKTLSGYAEFVEIVRNYVDNSGLSRTDAIEKAIEDCINKNVLKEFLSKHGGEIVTILQREITLDDIVSVREEDTREDIAEKMIKRGTPLDIVAEDTELSLEKIKKLAEKTNANK